MNERHEFIARFKELQPKFPRLCARHLGQAHLTLPQFVVLNLLIQSKATPMTEISTRLHITKPAVTSLVDRLERNKFVRRLEHAKDRRVILIQILSKGEKVVREMQTAILGPLLKTLEHFNASERKIVSRFYAELSKMMDRELCEGEGRKK